METAVLETTETRKIVFHRVAENLYRLESSGGYYALLKRGDKQFRRSLKTTDRKLADRRLTELRAQVGTLSLSEDARLAFEQIAQRWLSFVSPGLKPASITRRQTCIKNVAPFFVGLSIRNIQPQHCERWVAERGAGLAAQTFVHELDTMRLVFEYAVERGLILNNPAKGIRRMRIVRKPMQIPSREQFQQLLPAIRGLDRRARFGADLVELLAYSGCRLAEGTALRWRDIDFARGSITVTGGEDGTKNHEQRIIPMNDALRGLLERLKGERDPKSEDFVSGIDSAKKCLATACQKLGFPHFTHHDFRHFFATTCIESGVDIPTVSRWLGHKDGGALAMRVYGHLRQEHSFSMVKRVAF